MIIKSRRGGRPATACLLAAAVSGVALLIASGGDASAATAATSRAGSATQTGTQRAARAQAHLRRVAESLGTAAQAIPAAAAAAPDLTSTLTYVATGGASSGVVKTITGGTHVGDLTLTGPGVHSAAWSGDGAHLAWTGSGNSVTVVRQDGSTLATMPLSGPPKGGIAWSPDSDRLAVSIVDQNGHQAVQDTALQSPNTLSTFNFATAPFDTAVAFEDPNGYLLGSRDAVTGKRVVGRAFGGFGRITPSGAAAAEQWDPAFSPDRSRIAYVQDSGSGESVWTMDPNGAGPRKLVDVDVAAGGLAWTPDGLDVYVLTDEVTARLLAVPDAANPGVQQLTTLPSRGRSLSVRPHGVSVQPARLAGPDRIGTALAISQAAFGDRPGPGMEPDCLAGNALAVVLVRSDLFPDGLVSAPLAAQECAPLLMTPPTGLDARVRTEIRRVLQPGAAVLVVGSTGAVSAGTAAGLVADGFDVVRFSGRDRYETARQVAQRLDSPGTVLMATGLDFPDALVAGAAAGTYGAAVLLTNGSRPAAATDAYLADARSAHGQAAHAYAIGGPAATAYPAATPIVGSDRYRTAVSVAMNSFGLRTWPPAPKTVFVATGLNFPDAMAGGALAALVGQPLVLTPTGIDLNVWQYIRDRSPMTSEVVAFGGPSVVPFAAMNQYALLALNREP